MEKLIDKFEQNIMESAHDLTKKVIDQIKQEAGNKPWGIIYLSDRKIKYQIQGQEPKEIEL